MASSARGRCLCGYVRYDYDGPIDPALVGPAAEVWVDSSVPWSRIAPDLPSCAKGRT